MKVEPGYYLKVGQKIRVCVQFSESPTSRVIASFSWVSFIAIDIWMCLMSKQRMIFYEAKRLNSFIRYSLPFIPPTFIIVLTVILEHSSIDNEWKANYGLAVVCWIFGVKVKNFLFVLPAAVSVCITLLFCSLCACHLFRLWRATRNPTAKHRSYFWMFVKLAGMTGLGWCFGLVAIPSGSDALFCVFLILIAIQGAGLFSVLWGYKIMTLCTKDGKIKVKVKVTVGIQKFPDLPQYTLSGPIVQLWYNFGTLH